MKRKRTLPAALAAAGAVCIAAAAAAGTGIVGVAFSAIALGCLGAALILYGFLLGRAAAGRRWAKNTARALTALIALGAAAVIAAEIPVIASAKTDRDCRAPYVVVLGAGLHGTVPSLALQDRLGAALDYLERFPESVAVVSGGQGADEDITEAECMRLWLERRGVAPERILKEERATSTRENLAYSLALIREREGGDTPSPIALASSEYHMYRAKYMARQLGMAPVGVAADTTFFYLRANYFFREAFAVLYLWIFG